MRVEISDVHCQGHAMCNLAAGELFKLSEVDGRACLDSPDVPAGLETAARAGAAACPERAITVTE